MAPFSYVIKYINFVERIIFLKIVIRILFWGVLSDKSILPRFITLLIKKCSTCSGTSENNGDSFLNFKSQNIF